MWRKTIEKWGGKFSEPFSVREGTELLEKVGAYIQKEGFINVDNVRTNSPSDMSGSDVADIFYNPKNSVTIRVESSIGHEPADWRDEVYGQAEEEDVFSYIRINVKGDDKEMVEYFASELEKILYAGI
jgi:hypothetical protein